MINTAAGLNRIQVPALAVHVMAVTASAWT